MQKNSIISPYRLENSGILIHFAFLNLTLKKT